MAECSCGFDHRIIRKKCQESAFFTAKFLCGFPDVSENFHSKLCDMAQENERKSRNREGWFLPRGHLKTHQLNIARAVHRIIRDKNVRILMMQGSTSRATENMRIVRGVLESPKLKHYFPEIEPDQPWNDEEIQLKRDRLLPDPTISARGINSKITGGHFDLIIADDLVGEDNCMSEAEMDRCLRWMKNVSPLFVNPAIGTLVVIGTRWPNDKVYQYIYDTPGFWIFTAGCYVDERCVDAGFGEIGSPIWPERFTHDVLNEIKKTTPTFEWSHQYLNQPVTEALRVFPPSCIQYYDWLDGYETLKYQDPDGNGERNIKTSSLFKILTVDPAASGLKTADESAISVSGKAENARYFVLEDWGARVSVTDLVEQIFALYEKWKPNVVGIEKGAFMHVLRPFLEQKQLKTGVHFPIVQLDGQIRNKVKRIMSLEPYFKGKQVFIGRSHQGLQTQLLGFAPVEYKATGLHHDDRLDALAFHPKYWHSTFDVAEDEDRIRDADETKVDRWYGLECAM